MPNIEQAKHFALNGDRVSVSRYIFIQFCLHGDPVEATTARRNYSFSVGQSVDNGLSSPTTEFMSPLIDATAGFERRKRIEPSEN